MRCMKDFVIVEDCWYCWEILRFVSVSFDFLTHLLVIFLFVEAAKEFRMKWRNTMVPCALNFVWGIYDIFLAWNVFLNQ